jgi:hypothetical protein
MERVERCVRVYGRDEVFGVDRRCLEPVLGSPGFPTNVPCVDPTYQPLNPVLKI